MSPVRPHFASQTVVSLVKFLNESGSTPASNGLFSSLSVSRPTSSPIPDGIVPVPELGHRVRNRAGEVVVVEGEVGEAVAPKPVDVGGELPGEVVVGEVDARDARAVVEERREAAADAGVV
nr:unnamed protein product [Digitaria exilis]